MTARLVHAGLNPMDVPVAVAVDYVVNLEDLRWEDAHDVATGVAEAFGGDEEGTEVINDASDR